MPERNWTDTPGPSLLDRAPLYLMRLLPPDEGGWLHGPFPSEPQIAEEWIRGRVSEAGAYLREVYHTLEYSLERSWHIPSFIVLFEAPVRYKMEVTAGGRTWGLETWDSAIAESVKVSIEARSRFAVVELIRLHRPADIPPKPTGTEAPAAETDTSSRIEILLTSSDTGGDE